MAASKKKTLSAVLAEFRRGKLRRLKERTTYRQKILKLKAEAQQSSNSLLWVWEFSKKAVLICFLFYIVTQVYAMVVMVRFMDFSYLGSLIDSTKELTRDCVFAYLIKAGLENIGKIWFSHCVSPDSGSEGLG